MEQQPSRYVLSVMVFDPHTVEAQAPFEITDQGHIALRFVCGARAFFSTRWGGVSQGAYAELNLGPYTADTPAALAENRSYFASLVGVSVEALKFCKQVHGSSVLRVDSADLRSPFDPDGLPEADGCVTTIAGIVPVAVTADCLPVGLASKGVVAMLHAGWRGIAAGVLEAGVDLLKTLGKAETVEAAIGPGAGPCCYEVGAEVWQAVGLSPPAGGKGKIDLKEVAKERLSNAGVDRIYNSGLCTICTGPNCFFSYRRDGSQTGRQAGAVWLD